MKKLVLDSEVLIRQLRGRYTRPRRRHSPKDATGWAEELIKTHAADAIVTPVYIEVPAGTRDRHDLWITRAFLGRFRCIDRGDVPASDWHAAVGMAGRIPADGKARDLGDCLIRAIANRFDYDVQTGNRNFPE